MSRGMTKAEAIAYVGCKTGSAFDRWRKLGIICGPIPGAGRSLFSLDNFGKRPNRRPLIRKGVLEKVENKNDRRGAT